MLRSHLFSHPAVFHATVLRSGSSTLPVERDNSQHTAVSGTLPQRAFALCEQNPLKQHVQMRKVCQHITLHSLITFHHANTRGSRLQVLVCLEHFVIHVSRSLPHLTLTTSTSSLSYLSNLTVILSYTPKPVDSRSKNTLRGFTTELRFLGSPISHRL